MSSFPFISNFIILLMMIALINCGIYDLSHEFGGDHETLSSFEHLGGSHIPIDYYGHSSELYGHSVELGHHQALDDLTSKPVTGIDHGKGVISYSTTYEFPDDKH